MTAEKKLYRAQDSLLGGVCTGVADYFNIDPIIVQILTVVLTILSAGSLAVAYVALWIIIPRVPDSNAPVDVQPQEVHSDTYGAVPCSGKRTTDSSKTDSVPEVPYDPLAGSAHIPPVPPYATGVQQPVPPSAAGATAQQPTTSPDWQFAGQAQGQSGQPEPGPSQAQPHAAAQPQVSVPVTPIPEHRGSGGGGALWFGVVLLFIGLAALLGVFVTGVEWWQFWPLLFVIAGIGEMVVPGKKGHRMERFVSGLMQFAFGAAALPFSLGFVDLYSLEPILYNLWPILVIMCGLFIMGGALNSPLITLLAGFTFVAFCVIAIGWFSIPGPTEIVTLTLPTGREYLFDARNWI